MTSSSSDSLFTRAKAMYGLKSAKYLLVTVFNVLFGQSLLVLGSVGLGWSFVASNVFAVMISAGPAYLLSRYWVWQKTDQTNFLKEVVPFWILAFLGLLLSTMLASVASRYSDSTLVLMGANLAGFGGLWVAKFFILDRVLFKSKEPVAELDGLFDRSLQSEEGD